MNLYPAHIMTKSITDFDIQALIDNELSWEEEKMVRSAIADDRRNSQRYEELKTQKVKLQKWWTNLH